MNLKSKFSRIVALFISAVLTICALPLSVFAENIFVPSHESRVDAKRYMTDNIVSEGGKIEIDQNGYAVLIPQSQEPSIILNLPKGENNSNVKKTNSLRIVVKNSTSCDKFRLNYTYLNDDMLRESDNVNITLRDNKNPEEYIVHIDGADKLISVKLIFPCNGEGSITLLSVGRISYYFDEREYVGSLKENSYNRNTGIAQLSGNISYEMTVRYPEAKVVLYRLDQDKIIEDLRDYQSYISECDMTLQYGFSFKIVKTSDLCSRYFVALLIDGKRIIPVTPETYLKENYFSYESKPGKSQIGFKGIETNLYAGACEIGTSVAFVDVYLDKMNSNGKTGFQYSSDDGKEYYFDRAYVTELDKEIKSYASAGSSVYLRFLLRPNEESLKYADISSIPDNAKYISINPYSDTSVSNIYSCTDFLFRRYSLNGESKLKGVVLGRSLDSTDVYNYCEYSAMNDYVDMLARSCSIIRRVLDSIDVNLEMILPMSDNPFGVENIVDSEEKSYPCDLLTGCLVKALNHYGTDVSLIYFMVENNHSNLKWSVQNSDLEKYSQYTTPENCKKYTDCLVRLSSVYKDLNTNIIFSWFPEASLTLNDVNNLYIYNYNFLACNDNIRSFVISIFENNYEIETESTAKLLEDVQFERIKGTYKYADTHMNESISNPVLQLMNIKSWSEIIPGYNLSQVEKRKYYSKNLGYSVPISVTGRYCMWDFSQANGTRGWNASDGCKSLLVYTEPAFSSHSMVGCMKGKDSNSYGAEYGSIIHKFKSPLSTKDVSYITIDLFVTSDDPDARENDNYEIVITAGNGDSVCETVGTVKNGLRTKVVADITELQSADFLKISLKNLDSKKNGSEYNLCIEKIYFLSTNLNDRELEDKLSMEDKYGKPEINIFENGEAFSVTMIIVSSGLIIAIIAFLTYVVKSNRKEKE